MNGQKFSLSFSKRIERKALQPSALRGEGPVQQAAQAQALTAVDKDSLKANEHVEEKDQLVIPLLQAKRSAVLSRLAKLHQEDGGAEEGQEEASQAVEEDSKPLTLEEKAERALIEETKKKLDQWSSRDGKKDITIPAATTDDTLAAPLVDIGKESSLDDYDEIAVESYGAAILRGMGWKKSEGIGGRKKMVVDIINPAARTLGSSEGKETAAKKEGEGEAEEEEELPIVKGSFVYIHSGRHRGTYGVVEVVDEDHVLIKAAMGQGMLREVEANLRAATQKEYKESARVINKEMYDQYKEAEIKKKEADRKARDNEEEVEDRERGKEKNRESEKQNERLREGKEEKHREKNEERQREGNSERQREREGDKHRGRDGEKQREQESERHRDKGEERQRERDGERPRDKGEERQRNRDEARERKQKEKDVEKHRHKESKQELEENARHEKRDRERDRREKESSAKDRYARHHHGSDAPGVKRKKEESVEVQSKAKNKQQKVIAPPWVRENLRVRLINKNYKGGKYHKEKVVVVNVVTAECCECKAEGGRLLGNVDPGWLETVIPKQSPMVVMVVKGPYNGQKGRILQLHKDQEKASIQLLEDETTIVKLHYDDICEYVLR